MTPCIYYWKTVYGPTGYEQQRWDEARLERIYVRCFDVGLDPASGMPKPVGIIRNLNLADRRRQHIPVVFITQEVLHALTAERTGPVASGIASLLGQLFAGLPSPDEVQIDCDWTSSTQEAYFRLLRALYREPFFRDKTHSCTIRLHQVKYRLRSGIPPADRALLMCYNMGNLKQPGPHNSILDLELAENYLRDLRSYPLPLDVALPLFSWCLQFRGDRLVGILRDVAPGHVKEAAIFREKAAGLFTCTRDTVWNGYPFYAGDIVRTEAPGADEIREMAAYAARHTRNDSLRVILFHSDSLTLSKHPPDEIEAIFGAYH
jgi:hypothetical protein